MRTIGSPPGIACNARETSEVPKIAPSIPASGRFENRDPEVPSPYQRREAVRLVTSAVRFHMT
jgi:hypothetical protein